MDFQISEKRRFENPRPSHRICRKSLGRVQFVTQTLQRMRIQRCGKMSEKWAVRMSNTPELSQIVWETQRSDSQEVRSGET